jgi:hypothetical protein
MATPAQVANDMQAWANFWYMRGDDQVYRACSDAADLIRKWLDGYEPSPRAFQAMHAELEKLAPKYRPEVTGVGKSMLRAVGCLDDLRQGCAINV